MICHCCYCRYNGALCTWVNRGGQLKAELQLATDVICWQSATQRITHNPIPAGKRQWQTEKGKRVCEGELQEETGKTPEN